MGILKDLSPSLGKAILVWSLCSSCKRQPMSGRRKAVVELASYGTRSWSISSKATCDQTVLMCAAQRAKLDSACLARETSGDAADDVL